MHARISSTNHQYYTHKQRTHIYMLDCDIVTMYTIKGCVVGRQGVLTS